MKGSRNGSSDYEEVCRRFLKSEMAKRNLHWDDVVSDLASSGIVTTSTQLRQMLSKGTLRASLLMALIDIYEIDELNAREVQQLIENIKRFPVGSSHRNSPKQATE